MAFRCPNVSATAASLLNRFHWNAGAKRPNLVRSTFYETEVVSTRLPFAPLPQTHSEEAPCVIETCAARKQISPAIPTKPTDPRHGRRDEATESDRDTCWYRLGGGEGKNCSTVRARDESQFSVWGTSFKWLFIPIFRYDVLQLLPSLEWSCHDCCTEAQNCWHSISLCPIAPEGVYVTAVCNSKFPQSPVYWGGSTSDTAFVKKNNLGAVSRVCWKCFCLKTPLFACWHTIGRSAQHRPPVFELGFSSHLFWYARQLTMMPKCDEKPSSNRQRAPAADNDAQCGRQGRCPQPGL